MIFSIKAVIQTLIAFQALTFAVFLLVTTTGKRKSNAILALLLIILAIQMVGFLIQSAQMDVPLFENMNCVWVFFYGPLIHIYTQSLIYKNFRFKTQITIHSIPIAMILVAHIAFNQSCSNEIYFLYFGSLMLYMVRAFMNLKSYRQILRQSYSAEEEINLSWLNLALLLLTIIFFADLAQFLMNYFTSSSLPMLDYVEAFVLIWINAMVYKGLRHPGLFIGVGKKHVDITEQAKTKYKHSKLTVEQGTAMFSRLQVHMSNNQPFLNPQLTLDELASQLALQARTLSQVINQYSGQNFMDYINTYRIEMSKRLLIESEHGDRTVLDITYDCGFNSKSAFHHAFKKKTGLSPLNFKQQTLQQKK